MTAIGRAIADEEFRRKRIKLIKSLRSAPTRVCRTMHDCCLCDKPISYKQSYRDRGYGKRAHTGCVIRSSVLQARIDEVFLL